MLMAAQNRRSGACTFSLSPFFLFFLRGINVFFLHVKERRSPSSLVFGRPLKETRGGGGGGGGGEEDKEEEVEVEGGSLRPPS